MGSTEPCNYRGSYATGSKKVVDIEIAMYGNALGITTCSITIPHRTVAITTIELLFNMTMYGGGC